jgi:lysophospholipase L1-like esterase
MHETNTLKLQNEPLFMYKSLHLLLSIFVIVATTAQCQSQWQTPTVDITKNDTVGYGFFREEANIIQNKASLAPFFEKLWLQRTQGGRKINIVHIGDSHILGNFMTREMRKRMQAAFGDAGRGMIFPYKLINSNGPQDYIISTSARWSGTNCVRDQNELTDYGISGFSAVTSSTGSEISIQLRDTTSSTSSPFTKVTVFYRNNDGAPPITIEDENTHQVAVPVIEDGFSKAFYFDRPVSECTIKLAKCSGKKSFWLDGVSIDNERAGVIYHSIGVNGAKFSDFARAKFFALQLKEITPDLVILSFGTNEAQARNSPTLLQKQMDELTTQITTQWPHACILFTTPADSYLRGKGFNPNMTDVSTTIKDFALKKDFAYWDLFQIGGGENSAENWKSNGLMSSDSVHYSRTGYAAQGKLLYMGLISAYNESVNKKVAKAGAEGDGK